MLLLRLTFTILDIGKWYWIFILEYLSYKQYSLIESRA